MKNEIFDKLVTAALEKGAFKASVIDASKIETHPSFRDMCAANSCGVYGKCYMCPPDVGDADELTARLADYRYALVYQTVSELEDSFDFEGMNEAKKLGRKMSQELRKVFDIAEMSKVLHLGPGGCGVCEKCAKQTGEPCRFPDLALASLEAYGVNVSELAKSSGMKYINGQDTVTYFGTVLFCLADGE